ncbi:MAG: hypothetical protein RLZZ74_3631 [Cyanobacteriota bacterium]
MFALPNPKEHDAISSITLDLISTLHYALNIFLLNIFLLNS